MVTASSPVAGPEAPTLVRAAAERERSIRLSWVPPADTGITFDIARYTGADPWVDPSSLTALATGIGSSLWLNSAGLTEGTQYWYRIRTVKDGSVGPWSEPTGAIAAAVRRTGLDQRQAFQEADWGNQIAAVNLSTGNLVLSTVDSHIPLPTAELPQAVKRTYNSHSCMDCTLLGGGWQLNAEWRVETGAASAVVVTGDGTERRFAFDGTSSVPEARYYGSLVTDAGTGGWRFSFPDLYEYHFRSDGKLSKIQERNGNALLYSYDGSGRLAAITSAPVARSVTFSYDLSGRLAFFTDSAARTTQYGYDGNGRLSQVTNPAGEVHRHAYDAHGRLIRSIDAAGRWNQIFYGLNGTVASLVDELGAVTELESRAAGGAAWNNEAVVRDPEGNQTIYTIDSRGWPLQVNDALGNTTSFQYGFTSGQFTTYTMTDPRGLVTAYSYDSSGGVTQIAESPDANAETQELVAPGVGARTSSFGFQAGSGDLIDQGTQVGDATYTGSSSTYTYGTNPTFPYRLSQITSQPYTEVSGSAKQLLSGVVQYTFDVSDSHPGRLTQIQDPNGNLTDLVYNADGTVQSATRRYIDEPLVNAGVIATSRDVIQEYTYYADGRIKEIVDWHEVGTVGTAITHHEYDAMGRLVRLTYPDGSKAYTIYDPAGTPIMVVDRAGQSQIRLQDAARRTVTSIESGGARTAYAYDAAGRNTAITDAMGQITQLQYDGLNRVV